MPNGSVMLGYIHGGWVRAEFLNSVLNAVSGPDCDPAIGGVISSSAGPLVALGRNLLVKQFLGHNLEWLCMVDTDIVFSTNTVSRLLESADDIHRPIMSALYLVFHDSKRIAAAYANMGKGSDLDVVPMGVLGDGVHRVFAVGAGCMLVHRSVFETIRKDAGGEDCWFREGVIEGRDFGEDVSFCIRASISRFPAYVNAGVRVGHMKTAMLGEVN